MNAFINVLYSRVSIFVSKIHDVIIGCLWVVECRLNGHYSMATVSYYNEIYTVRAPLLLAVACIFFAPFFTAVYNQEQLILQTIFVLNKEMWN